MERLILDLIKRAMMEELSWHSAHGLDDYKMTSELKDFIRRARAIGLTVELPYEGYSYMDQAA